MKMKSKIKSLFSKDMRHELAAICDTKRIEKNTDKMDLVVRLLRSNGISFDLLGGATNRIVIMMDGYAIKIAVDRQGYKDNLMEFSLCRETQPYTTKSYETNGYLLIQACVRLITIEEWRARKQEILKILDIFGSEYLLGDVGYYDLNMTNWGVQDDGSLVILDYAYCHRLTEKLFTCPVCGSVLTYDMNYVNFLCSDRANCHEKYSYNDIKSIQGDDVDWELIDERKRSAVLVPDGKDFVEVMQDFDKLLDSRTVLIRSYRDLESFKEEKNIMTKLDMNNPELLDHLAQATLEKLRGNESYAEELVNQVELPEEEIQRREQLECVVDPLFAERMEYDSTYHGKIQSKRYDTVEETTPVDTSTLFGDLLSRLNNQSKKLVPSDILYETEETITDDERVAKIGSFNLLDEFGVTISSEDDLLLPESSTLVGTPFDTDVVQGNALGEELVNQLETMARDASPAPPDMPIDDEDEENIVEETQEDSDESDMPDVVEQDCEFFVTEPVTLDPDSGTMTEQVLLYMTGESPNTNVVLDQLELKETHEELYEGVAE